MKQRMRRGGFTLIELAIGLFVIALLMASILTPLATQVARRQAEETDTALRDIRQALIGYAQVNGRLPRPAISANDGAENPTPCSNEAACTGFLPWAELGVAPADGWGKLFRYSVTPAYTVTPLAMTTPGTKAIQTRDGMPGGTLTDILPDPTPGSATIVAVVLSHGRDNWGTSEITSGALPDSSATNLDEDANAAATVKFITRVPSDNPAGAGGEFDDRLMTLSSHELFAAMLANGITP